jgi:S1-C subfamily serine protease
MRLRHRAEGGLALSADGRVLGMAVRGPRGRTLVIPSATIERTATVLLEHGQVPRGYLGLGLHQIVATGGGPGAMVMSVDPNGPAAIAGILQGDIILRWNGTPVPSVNTLLRTLDHQSVGQSITLTIRRAGADIEAAVTIATRPPK